MRTKVDITLVVTMCAAIATGVWALSGEVRNARLKLLIDGHNSQEHMIQAAISDRTKIWMAIERQAAIGANIHEDIQEIKDTLKEMNR